MCLDESKVEKYIQLKPEEPKYHLNATHHLKTANWFSSIIQAHRGQHIPECPKPVIHRKQDSYKHRYSNSGTVWARDKFVLSDKLNQDPIKPKRSLRHTPGQENINHTKVQGSELNQFALQFQQTKLKPDDNDNKQKENYKEDDILAETRTNENVPVKPCRSYKGRGSTLLCRAVQLIKCQLYQEAFQPIKHLIDTVTNEKNNSKDFDVHKTSRTRKLLSSLNLFLALSAEGIRDPGEPIDIYKDAPNEIFSLVPQHREKNILSRNSGGEKYLGAAFNLSGPIAISQLKSNKCKYLYIENVPTLLLFNLIFGKEK